MEVIDNGQGTPEASPALDATSAESSPAQAEELQAQGAEEGQEPETSSEKQKPWYQRRIDEITAARRETERQNARLLALLEQQTRAQQIPEQQPPPSVPTGKPQLEQFQTYEDYTEALSDWKVRNVLEQREAQQRMQAEAQRAQQVEAEFARRVQEAAAKTPEVVDAMNDPTLPISPAMADVIRSVNNGPDVVLHLSRNRDEAARLANLPPHVAAFELGRLAAGIQPAQPRRITPPPAPINTLGGGTVAAEADPSRMTDAQFAAWRRQQIAQRQGR